MSSIEERHPEVFREVINESPRGKQRTVTMEVLCLGFLRTGTATMSTAMETLGMPCWHSLVLLSDNFGDIPMWQEAYERKYRGAGTPFGRDEFDQLLHSFGAVLSDTPAIAFAEDLIAAYPEAKVVLVERDIESWYNSYMNTIVEQTFKPWWYISRIVFFIDRFYFRPIGMLHLAGQEHWAGIKSRKDAEEKLRDKYREHYELIRRVTPKERLLEFKLSDGWARFASFWESLCRKRHSHTSMRRSGLRRDQS